MDDLDRIEVVSPNDKKSSVRFQYDSQSSLLSTDEYGQIRRKVRKRNKKIWHHIGRGLKPVRVRIGKCFKAFGSLRTLPPDYSMSIEPEVTNLSTLPSSDSVPGLELDGASRQFTKGITDSSPVDRNLQSTATPPGNNSPCRKDAPRIVTVKAEVHTEHEQRKKSATTLKSVLSSEYYSRYWEYFYSPTL